jgi:hypothetical protein
MLDKWFLNHLEQRVEPCVGKIRRGDYCCLLHDNLWRRYFYRLCGALSFTGKTLYAVIFSSWIGLLLRCWMSWRISPVKHSYGADFYTYTVSSTHVPVDSYIGSMYAKFIRRFHRSPDIMIVMLTYDFAVFLKI